jgi:prolyl-tRNA editing enzyme YbaK/EbsC (Cys-tRNA(Pro) deacylase)
MREISRFIRFAYNGSPAYGLLTNDAVEELKGPPFQARFVAAEEAAVLTGHAPGGMCPFGLISSLPIYCDLQVKRFDVVVTGGGATHSAVIIDPLRMAAITGAEWVDVCDQRVSG